MVKKLSFLFLVALFFNKLNASVITCTAAGSWATGSTWSGGSVPTSTDNVVISGFAVTISANESAASLTVTTGGSVSFTNNHTLTLSGGLTLSSTGAISANKGTYTAATFSVTSGANAAVSGVSLIISGTSQIDGVVTFNNATGAPDLQGNVTVGTAGSIQFSAAQTIFMDANLTAKPGATIGGGSATGIVNVGGNFSVTTGGTTSLGGLTLSVTGNVTIPGTAVLDASASGNSLSVGGNWTATSSAAADFIYGTSLVTFNGTSGTQTIATNVSGGETFYDLTISNTSAAAHGVQFQKSVTINDAYIQTSGAVDLKGNNLNITGAPSSAATSKFTAGSIITSVAGSSVTVTDANNVKAIYFSGLNFGDATNGIAITCSSNDSYFNGGTFYGNVAFTKIGTGSDECDGGCTFYGPCSFTTIAGGDRWRMGNTNPDIFYNATFNHYNTSSTNNFIIARQTTGNQFYGTTTFYSESPGGLYVSRNNTSANASADFHGPVYITVAKTGNVKFAESSSSIQNSTTFEDLVQINSVAASTGDVFIGTASQSTVNLTSNARFVAGSILGATTVYLYGVTQTGTTYTHTMNSTANGSVLKIGVNGASTFAGSLNFSFPTIQIANNTFNGLTNSFVFTGTVNSTTSNGNNTFAVGTSTTFSNSGTGDFALGVGSVGADIFNGNVTFVQTGSGVLEPAYSSNSTFGGNISTAGSTTAITFGAGSGTVTVNGTSTQTFSGSATYAPIINSLAMSATGPLTLSVPVYVSGTLALTSGLINTTATNILTMQSGATVTTPLSTSATSYVNGPMDCQLATTTKTTLKFPIGTGGDCRPVSLLAQNATTSLYNYTGTLYHASAFSVGTYTNYPATVDTLSGVHYWQIARTNSVSVSSPALDVSGNQQVTLYFDTDDQVYDGGLLTVCKTTTTSTTNWYDIGNGGCSIGATQFSTPQVGTIASSSSPTAFTSFSYFTLGRLLGAGKNSLPIELLSFSAVPDEEKVDVKWETVTETNNSYFTIEKSKDGKTFTKFIDVKGAGNSTSYRNYAETDYQPYAGTSYYRLKQTDYNGNYTYFNMVSVNFSIQKNVVLYPNPIDNTSSLNIKVQGYQDEEVVVVLRDAQGREFLSKVLLSEGDNQLFIVDETKSLTPGAYIVTASSNDKIYNYKLIVK